MSRVSGSRRCTSPCVHFPGWRLGMTRERAEHGQLRFDDGKSVQHLGDLGILPAASLGHLILFSEKIEDIVCLKISGNILSVG